MDIMIPFYFGYFYAHTCLQSLALCLHLGNVFTARINFNIIYHIKIIEKIQFCCNLFGYKITYMFYFLLYNNIYSKNVLFLLSSKFI